MRPIRLHGVLDPREEHDPELGVAAEQAAREALRQVMTQASPTASSRSTPRGACCA
jgi:hypothetical protein